MLNREKNRRVNKNLNNYFAILEKKQKPRFKRELKLLEKNIAKAKDVLKSCRLCERRCRVDRTHGEFGYCRVADKMVVSSIFPHLGEEYFLVPSLTIFFISCTFRCEFCQNSTISQRKEKGEIFMPERLAKMIDDNNQCKNINFVGGEPTPYLPMILESLRHVQSDMPVVWNSNFYMSR
ncbi:radical SAM protein [Candidatus Woesearchaeota archaeon]|nr:radical SAM protein [Candidatus Woesearchaeota archaeon]